MGLMKEVIDKISEFIGLGTIWGIGEGQGRIYIYSSTPVPERVYGQILARVWPFENVCSVVAVQPQPEVTW